MDRNQHIQSRDSASRSEKTTPTVVMSLDLPGVRKLRSGKVREIFEIGDHLLIVATDRISAFDCVLPNPIPGKGVILNRLSAWWFKRLSHLVDHHLISTQPEEWPDPLPRYAELLRGRAMLVRRVDMIPIECVVRGYLAGSAWREYVEHGQVCGLRLRPGYQMSERLDEPIFTPSTKAATGHDENISFERMASLIGADLAEEVRRVSLQLYEEAAAHAQTRGILIADTKFEFGLSAGRLVLADEVLTPDSSRFWPADSYTPGISPPSFDKQFVRDYLEQIGWSKRPPAPPLPDDIIRKTQEKYIDAYRRLTGEEPF